MTDIDRIKAAVDLAALIEQDHHLDNGKKYRRAKDHDSLVVNVEKQTYIWYSKGEEKGDAIDYVGRYRLNYNGQWSSSDPAMFKEALCWLAKWAGQPEPQFKPEDAEARAQRLSRERLMSLAADYYQDRLQNKDIQGYQYALQRGFTPEIIQKARLGSSDGQLWQAIPESDRPTAVELGLIAAAGRRWKDAIPAGYLVYCHSHQGRIEYLAGRAIAEKLHMNQRSTKKVFWATWPGWGPLVIVEGQADAISSAQLGVAALGLCGTNLSDFDPEWIKLFCPVYVWQDDDEPGSQAAKNWQKRLNDLAAALGPLIRVISTAHITENGDAPASAIAETGDDSGAIAESGDDAGAIANSGDAGHIKDANDFLKEGYTPDDLQKLLKAAPTWLDLEIDRIKELKGADLYDALEPLFGHLKDLDIFQLNVYRSKICKDLNVSQGDFGRYLKAAKGTLSEDEESDFAKGGQYVIQDGWTVLKTFTDDGRPKIMSLAAGTAKIIEEISLDDGSNEPQLDFLIAGELATGQRLPKIQIPAAEFSTMKWVSKWGSRFILSAGRSTQDHFRAAVQHLSGTPEQRTIYTHTGWRKINDKWLFLTSSGALGSGDATIQVDLKMGRPDTHMVRYNLPTPQDITQAMQASLAFWYIADLSITVPIWAAMYLAPLAPFLNPDFGLWVHGLTGSMKSSIVAAGQSHFGQWQGKDAKAFLPSNFQSTANAILLNAFQAKDVPLVIDDFAPGATAKEMRDRDATASNLLRSIGNKAARGRMRDGRHFQADFPPRCFAIITAEDLPPTASIMARGIGVRVQMPPKGHPDRTAIEKRLTQAQTVDSYFYPHAMAAFILWVQRHWEELERDLPVMAAGYRDQMQAAGHARLPDAFGKLMAAIDTALFFAADCGAVTESQAKERKAKAFESMGLMMSEHGEAIAAIDACQIFRETLQENLDARLWYLCPINAESTSPPLNSPVGAICVGYYDDACIYLLTKTVVEVMQTYQRLGTPFPVGKTTLYKRLAERGWLLPSEKSSDTVYIPVLNTSPRVLKLIKKEIFPE